MVKITTDRKLKEPFRSFWKIQKLAEKGKALYCFQEATERKRTYADIGQELGVSRAYVEELVSGVKEELKKHSKT